MIRNRRLPFPLIILFMLNFLKRSLQFELDSFFQALNQSQTLLRTVTKSAFCRDRSKFSHRAFIELNHALVDYMEAHAPLKTWCGLRLLAMDGTTLRLPNNPATLEHFGSQPDSAQRNRPMARASHLYDLLNCFTLDAAIHPYRVDERELALQHGPSLQPGDLLLLDRGYPAFWFFAWLLSESVHFCARVSISSWGEVQRFAASGKREQVITIHPTQASRDKCRRYALSTAPITLRLVRVSCPKGDDQFLLASLLDSQAFPLTHFQDLYHFRWGVEESYKHMKCRIEIENFTGKSVESVYQDFHAKIFSMNLAAAFVHSI
ncbi:IS4 family transposase [bacterium]|nr:IS4 family transposase [bacterium]